MAATAMLHRAKKAMRMIDFAANILTVISGDSFQIGRLGIATVKERGEAGKLERVTEKEEQKNEVGGEKSEAEDED